MPDTSHLKEWYFVYILVYFGIYLVYILVYFGIWFPGMLFIVAGSHGGGLGYRWQGYTATATQPWLDQGAWSESVRMHPSRLPYSDAYPLVRSDIPNVG